MPTCGSLRAIDQCISISYIHIYFYKFKKAQVFVSCHQMKSQSLLTLINKGTTALCAGTYTFLVAWLKITINNDQVNLSGLICYYMLCPLLNI